MKKRHRKAQTETPASINKQAFKPGEFLNRYGGWISTGLYLIITLALFREFFLTGKMLFGSDSIPDGVFFRRYLRDFFLANGEFPLWNPYLFGGMPFIDAMSGDTFYPAAFLKFIMPLYKAMGFKLILHMFLAGVFMYRYLRETRVGVIASMLGGLAYQICPLFLSPIFAGNDSKIYMFALFPLMFLFLERSIRTRKPLDFLLLGGALGLLILTSHIQLAYYAFGVAGLYVIYRLVWLFREERPAAIRVIIGFTAAVIIGVSLGLVQLLPAMKYTKKYSVRKEKGTYEYATSWSLNAEEVVSLAVPEFVNYDVVRYRYWGENPFKYNTEYMGILPLVFGILSLFCVRTRRVKFLWIIGLLVLIYALGASTPVFRLFYAVVPGVKLFRVPSIIMYIFAFTVVVTFAKFMDWLLGLDEKSRQEEGNRALKGLAVIVGILLIAAILLSAAGETVLSAWKQVFYSEIPEGKTEKMIKAFMGRNLPAAATGFWLAFLFIGFSAISVWLFLKGKLSAIYLAGIIGILVLVDGWRIDRDFIKFIEPELHQDLREDNAVKFFLDEKKKWDHFRVDSRLWKYSPNYLGLQRIENVFGFHNNEPQQNATFTRPVTEIFHYWARVRESPTQRERDVINRFWDLANVKYIITPGGREKDEEGALYQLSLTPNEDVLPRAYVVGNYIVETDIEKGLDIIYGSTFRPNVHVLLEKDPGIPRGRSVVPPGIVKSLNYEGNSVRIKVSMSKPGIFVLVDPYFPYWKAWLDGEPSEILRANLNFRAIALEKGDHEILMTYISRPYVIGRNVTFATVLLIVGGIIFSVVRTFPGIRKKGKNKT